MINKTTIYDSFGKIEITENGETGNSRTFYIKLSGDQFDQGTTEIIIIGGIEWEALKEAIMDYTPSREIWYHPTHRKFT